MPSFTFQLFEETVQPSGSLSFEKSREIVPSSGAAAAVRKYPAATSGIAPGQKIRGFMSGSFAFSLRPTNSQRLHCSEDAPGPRELMDLRLIDPESPEEWAAARRLIEEYAASLDFDLCFQGFEAEVRDLPREYGPPAGVLLLAAGDSGWLGCVALRKLSEGVAEMKRLYVTPTGRGQGFGRALVEEIVARARRLGYARIVLDTVPSMRK